MTMMQTQDTSRCFSQFFAIFMLPFLFFCGLAVGYIGIIPLHVELHTLVIIAFIFLVFALFVRHNASYAVCSMRGTFGRMESELVAAIKENALTILGETKSTLDIREYTSEYYKEIRDDNFARVAPAVFPMLGILGTFIAIALSMPDFTVQDLGALDREISAAFRDRDSFLCLNIWDFSLTFVDILRKARTQQNQ